MERHPFFDLWLHSTAALEARLEGSIIERVTLHEWPLSCVQRLQLADGRQYIYKAQSKEGVEAQFYRRVRSPLLPEYRSLGRYSDTTAMLLEYLPWPRLDTVELTPAERLETARRAAAAVAQIPQDAPLYDRLSGRDAWQCFAARAIRWLEKLIHSGLFTLTPPDTPRHLAAWASSEPVLRAVSAPPVLAHADLSAQNIFVTPGGLKIIDWQFPRLAPPGFDLATLLEDLGEDPRLHLDPLAIRFVWFTRLAWFSDAKLRLFQEGTVYDQQVAELAKKILETEA